MPVPGALLLFACSHPSHSPPPDASPPRTSLVISRDPAVDQATPAAAHPILAAEGLIVLASSRIGFAAVDAHTLALRWRRPLVPAGPAVALGRERLALPGPAGAEIVRAADGVTISLDPSPLPGGHAWPTSAGLAWARGGTVVVAGTSHALRAEPAPDPLAVVATADSIWAVWPDGVAGPAGFSPFPEPLLLGASGPVAAAGGMAYVADDTLFLPRGAAEGRFAHVPGALAMVDGELRAFRLTAGQARPVRAEGGPDTDTDPVPAISVLGATFGPRGAAALVHAAGGDRIRGWTAAGRATLDVPAPPPPDDAVRFFPPRLLLTDEATWVFLDGRVILRLSAP